MTANDKDDDARAPAWLADFQGRFGSLLTTPLERQTGTLRARTDVYDPALGATDGPRAKARDRLAVYHRQVWFRLFGVLQAAYPLTARLLGYWHFNDFAARFLSARPPTSWDIDRAADGFAEALPAWIDEPGVWAGSPLRLVERAPLLAAAELDATFRAVFSAPITAPFRPTPDDAARLFDAHLVPSPTARVVSEAWPLASLRHTIVKTGDDAEVLVPPPLPTPAFWLIVRSETGVGQRRLAPLEATLLGLLSEHSVGEALARLEALCPEEERATLPTHTRAWLAEGVARGYFSGLRD
jgi:hypothetical protein